MKKLIILSFLVALSGIIMAQSGTTVTMGTGSTQATYTPVAADTINGTSATSKYWVFLVNKPTLYYYAVTCRVNQVTTTARAAGTHAIMTMAGSIDGTNYVTIDTTLFHPTTGNYGEDLPHLIAYDLTTGVLWRYLKFTLAASDANKGAKLHSLSIKIGERY
jgi:hypothetical protein